MTAHTPRRSSVRFAIVAVVCLLLGAVTTVGVAWVLAYRLADGPRRLEGFRSWHGRIAWIMYRASSGVVVLGVDAGKPRGASPDGDPATLATIAEISRMPHGRLAATKGDVFVGGSHEDGYWEFHARGWPWLCLWHERLDAGSRGTNIIYPGAIEIDAIQRTRGARSDALALPCRPLWPGFCGDTALYAAAWALILVGPGAVRRRVRVRRGRCAHCAYDLKGAPPGPCSECGHPPAKSSS